LWRGRARLWGLVPVVLGVAMLALLRPPDLLVSGDGRHVGITGLAGGDLVVLREARSDFARENLTELAGMNGPVRLIDNQPGARCSAEFCEMTLDRGDRRWRLLLERGQDLVPYPELIAACARADIVIADRRLPQACSPKWLKADRAMLERTGGIAIDLDRPRITTVAQGQGEHGWWQPVRRGEAGQARATCSRALANTHTVMALKAIAPVARGCCECAINRS